MATTRFRRVGTLARGYDVRQVDAFMAKAARGQVTSAEVRSIGFDLRLGGYDVGSVDAALDRLEDQAAAQERDGERRALGDRGFEKEITSQAQILRSRLARPHGDRFARGSALERSYDVDQVDDICDDVAEYFAGQRSLAAETLRSAVFSPRRGARGYSERAVDRFIDKVISIMSKVQ
ncbi:MAG: DivIVA domain-containing protein [Angustibacter sp.]